MLPTYFIQYYIYDVPCYGDMTMWNCGSREELEGGPQVPLTQLLYYIPLYIFKLLQVHIPWILLILYSLRL